MAPVYTDEIKQRLMSLKPELGSDPRFEQFVVGLYEMCREAHESGFELGTETQRLTNYRER